MVGWKVLWLSKELPGDLQTKSGDGDSAFDGGSSLPAIATGSISYFAREEAATEMGSDRAANDAIDDGEVAGSAGVE